MEFKFKQLSTKKEVDLNTYVKDFMEKYPESKVFVGCDSQTKGSKTIYAIVIVFHQPNKGGHVLFAKEILPRINNRNERLRREFVVSVEVADYLFDNELCIPDFVDIDLSPDPKFKSNEMLVEAINYIKWHGFEPRWKPDSAIATHTADVLCR
jgi:predicted RNase H-related nuclease YkuK (DUF458 family)